MSPIAVITNLTPEQENQWLVSLQHAMPKETLQIGSQMTDSKAKKVNIAIVSNPIPHQLKRFPNLIWIQSLWAGVENIITIDELKNVKIVRLVDPKLSRIMAEAVLTWTLYLHRNIPRYALQQTNKNWHQLPYIEANERRVGILGTGKLGIAAINLLSDIGFQVNAWSRHPKQLAKARHFSGKQGLGNILSQSDIVVCLLPLTTKTSQLLNMDTLRLLPKGAQLINFARAAIVDTQALLTLLDKQHISHAVLDVFEQEPLPAENSLWTHPGISVLPHIAAPTTLNSTTTIVANNISRYRTTGCIPDIVDRTAGY